jgi:hypothetical protein
MRWAVKNRRCVALALGWVCAILLWFPRPVSAATDTMDASPSSDALQDTVWFDAEQGSIIPIKVKPREDDSLNRDSRWLPKPKRVQVPDNPSANAAGGGGAAGTGTGWFGTDLTLGNLLGWLLLVSLVTVLVLAIAYALSKSDFDFASGSSSKRTLQTRTPDQQTIERMKHLPAELRRSGVDFRSEAERLMEASQFDQAIILLFAHQLLLLDRAGLLRLNRGKTNRRYVRETRSSDPTLAGYLQETATAFERSYFGRHSIDREKFTRLWKDNETLEQSIERRQEVAA